MKVIHTGEKTQGFVRQSFFAVDIILQLNRHAASQLSFARVLLALRSQVAVLVHDRLPVYVQAVYSNRPLDAVLRLMPVAQITPRILLHLPNAHQLLPNIRPSDDLHADAVALHRNQFLTVLVVVMPLAQVAVGAVAQAVKRLVVLFADPLVTSFSVQNPLDHAGLLRRGSFNCGLVQSRVGQFSRDLRQVDT